jgi:hypothetical protein
MSMNDLCKGCSVPYGHKGVCPEIRPEYRADWQRGKDDAAAGRESTPDDESNEAYLLGRKMHELDANGQLPKPRGRRSIRVPFKSEPRLAAVGSNARTSS